VECYHTTDRGDAGSAAEGRQLYRKEVSDQPCYIERARRHCKVRCSGEMNAADLAKPSKQCVFVCHGVPVLRKSAPSRLL
jgi:hypothetical protein